MSTRPLFHYFAITQTTAKDQTILRIRTTQSLQTDLAVMFEQQAGEFLTPDTEEIPFDGNYKVEDHEVFVLDTLGREVWRWSKGRMFTQLLQNMILRTDDTLAYGERWKDAPRGQYVAVARLASSNYPIEQRTAFVVR